MLLFVVVVEPRFFVVHSFLILLFFTIPPKGISYLIFEYIRAGRPFPSASGAQGLTRLIDQETEFPVCSPMV